MRKALGLSLIAAAVGARVAESTLRLYEASPESVSFAKRSQLDAYYESLRRMLDAQASQPPAA